MALMKHKAKPAKVEKAIIVCTDKRGVFFGFAQDWSGDRIILSRPRMIVYWSVDVKGILGLAATGPSATCRVTAAPPRIEVRGITAVIECSSEAVAAWERGPWQS